MQYSVEFSMNYLTTITKQILLANKDGVSKVKLAKMIYFVHKGLVQKKLAKSEDLKFIRMPLGPVPVGFQELSKDSEIRISEENNALEFNKQLYTLDQADKSLLKNNYEVVESLVDGLKSLSTSTLVGHSHNEPSWKKLRNGTEYFLGSEDISRPLPKRSDKAVSNLEDQKLQSKLVSGLTDDIVEESSKLEYPKD